MLIRYASACSSGTFMTLGLFYIMQTLIAMDPIDIAEPVAPVRLVFARLIEEKPVAPDEPPPMREKLTKIEETPPRLPRVLTGPRTGVKPPPPPEPPGPDNTIGGWMQDGPLVAIVRVEPAYPARPQQAGLEGYVTVQFDVNPDGSVTNITVIESSNTMFEKAAIRAAAKFRYKARVVDGVAQATYGLQNRFVFKMERG